MRHLYAAVGALMVSITLTACGATSEPANPGGFAVVTTVTQVSALVRAVGGEQIRLTALLTAKDDPHEYELKPEQVSRLSRARVIFVSGAGADRWLDSGARAAGVEGRLVHLSDSVKLRRGTGVEAAGVDPHWWYDVDNAVAAAEAIAQALVAADPAHAEGYRARAAAQKQRLLDADRNIHALIDPIAPGRRLFVANHDAFNYFLERYGITLVGDIVPSTDAVAAVRPADIAALVAAIRARHVCAVFTETTMDTKLAAQIAAEGRVKVFDGKLYGDAIGDPGTAGATLEGALLHNAKVMARAFTSC